MKSSRSLWDAGLPHLEDLNVPLGSDGTRKRYVAGPEEQRLRIVERTVDLGEEGRYLVAVAGDAQEVEDEAQSFDRALVVTFGVLATALLLTTMFQVRFGLAPLKRISASLAAIRGGTAERLEGRFPEEIAPLARETNALIDANREIVERARTHVGNLAHALKTPLSVIVNEAAARGEDPLAAKVREQAAVMRDQVQHHLERARIAARATVIGTVTEVAPVVTAMARTMEKIHRDRGIAIDIETAPATKFRGEKQDLEEMVGNLVDNACKWAQSRVTVEVFTGRAESAATHTLRVVVDDDGPGLNPVAARAHPGAAPRQPARRDQARLGAWSLDRDRSRRALWGRADLGHGADRGTAGRAGAAGGLTNRLPKPFGALKAVFHAARNPHAFRTGRRLERARKLRARRPARVSSASARSPKRQARRLPARLAFRAGC